MLTIATTSAMRALLALRATVRAVALKGD
jgi:hypothetical protein